MKRLKQFYKKIFLHYLYGSSISIGTTFILLMWLNIELSNRTINILGVIFIISALVMIIFEYFILRKQTRSIRTALLSDSPSENELKLAYTDAHRFPKNSGLRVLGPRFFSVLVPTIILVDIAKSLGWINISNLTIFLLSIGMMLGISIHALIEFFLNFYAIKPILEKLRIKYQKLTGRDLSLNGEIIVSMKQKFILSTFLIGVFPIVLFFIGIIIHLQKINLPINSILVFAAVSLILGLILAMFGSWLIFKNINEPIQNLIVDIYKVSSGKLDITVSDDYSDEFSYLVNGVNRMINKLNERKQKNDQLIESIYTTLSTVLDARDRYTAGHSERVAHYATEIARRAHFSKEDMKIIKQSALLHDIGKVGVTDEILLKDGPLTFEEYESVKEHSAIGYSIIEKIEPHDLIEELLPGIRHHHERYDGKGYPDGLKGEAIPVSARIIAVADAFDSMTTNRPYRDGMPIEKAMSILQSGQGTQWDESYVDLFLDYAKEELLQKWNNEERNKNNQEDNIAN